ncbi:MAG: CHAD domain-containing protein [Thermoplasmata archaeon]|nr:CHAD domain-containing protein [Candidatus Sysuiplasma jiujiangense]
MTISIRRYEVSAPAFLQRYFRYLQSLQDRLESFIILPGAEEMHDLRIAIRKLRVASELLPKSMRNERKLVEYISACKLLFRKSACIRDLDIINERITAYADRGTSAELSRFIEKQRRMHLPGVLEYGNSLNQTRIPDISSDKINSKILSCRFEKVLKKHAAVCDESLRMVAAKKDDANALHRLRKNIRELRYTLELFPENKKIAPTLKTLAEWQQVLGSIRDIDIALFFLKKRKMTSRANDIRKKALRDRSLNYAAFLKLASDDGILDGFRSLKIEPH